MSYFNLIMNTVYYVETMFPITLTFFAIKLTYFLI